MVCPPSAGDDRSKRRGSEEILLSEEMKVRDLSPASSSSSQQITSNGTINEKPLLSDEKLPSEPFKDPLLHRASVSDKASTEEEVQVEHPSPPLREPLQANNAPEDYKLELEFHPEHQTTPTSPGQGAPLASLMILPSVSSPTETAGIPDSDSEREDGLIFDDNDSKYPTVKLRLQTLKASSKQDYLAKGSK